MTKLSPEENDKGYAKAKKLVLAGTKISEALAAAGINMSAWNTRANREGFNGRSYLAKWRAGEREETSKPKRVTKPRPAPVLHTVELHETKSGKLLVLLGDPATVVEAIRSLQ
jgi:hypothetical protein